MKNNSEIIIDKILLKCPACGDECLKEGMGVVGYSRDFNYDYNTGKGDCRCDNCGFKFKFIAEIKTKISKIGFSCGVCGKLTNNLIDNYFCKDCYKEHIKEDNKYHEELIENNNLKLKEFVKSKDGEVE